MFQDTARRRTREIWGVSFLTFPFGDRKKFIFRVAEGRTEEVIGSQSNQSMARQGIKDRL